MRPLALPLPPTRRHLASSACPRASPRVGDPAAATAVTAAAAAAAAAQ